MELSYWQVITMVTVERKIIDLRKMSVQIYKFNKEKHGLKVYASKMTLSSDGGTGQKCDGCNVRHVMEEWCDILEKI